MGIAWMICSTYLLGVESFSLLLVGCGFFCVFFIGFGFV